MDKIEIQVIKNNCSNFQFFFHEGFCNFVPFKLYDVELKKIQDDLALKSLENESMIGLIKRE